MTTRSYAAMPVVETTGPLAAAWEAQLTDVHVDTRVSLPSLATLRFRDPSHQLLKSTGIAIGTPLKISAATVAERRRVVIFTGEVTGVTSETEEEGGTFTVLSAYDRAHRLTRGRRVAAWRETTLGTVVQEIAGHADLKAGSVAGSTDKYESLVQPNITDWEFLQSLAELRGAIVGVDGDTLSLQPPQPANRAPEPQSASDQSPYVLSYGRNLLSLQVAVSSPGPAGNIQVRGWNSDAKQAVVGTAKVDDSRQFDIGTRPGLLARSLGGGTLTEVVGTGYALQSDLQAAASSLAGTAAATSVDLEATVYGSPHLRAGTPVTLVNVGKPFTGRYTVTGARHLFDSERGYRTQLSVTSGQWAPHAARSGPLAYAVPGLAIGIVRDVHEPGDRQAGAVKVSFPWLDDSYTSDWARTMQFGGEGGGGVISPSVGDEVLVGFEQGRLDRPYVLGGLYNGVDRPGDHSTPLTDANSKKVNRRSLSSRGGDRIELLDVPDGRGVLLTTGDNELLIRLNRDESTITIEAAKLEFKGTDSISLNTPDLKLGSGQKIGLAADDIEFNGKNSVTITSPKVDVK